MVIFHELSNSGQQGRKVIIGKTDIGWNHNKQNKIKFSKNLSLG